jgi:formylglycine-generating enzyme
MRKAWLAGTSGAGLLFAACSLFVDTSGLDTLADASADAVSDTKRDVTPTDAGHEASASDAHDGAHEAGACPSGRGPSMIDVGLFCVDSTETTNAEYAAFLASSPDLGTQMSVCSWNTTFVPSTGWPATAGLENNPVVWVDWCDAYAYCQWAVKRMCGAIDGGSFSMADYANPSVDQHFYACSMGAALIYPYGDAWSPTRCNGANAGYGDTQPVGSLKGCVGGYPGLYDMVGNVEEWQDSCTGTAGASDICVDGTGAFDFPSSDSGAEGTRCDFLDTDFRNAHFQDVGIRCCSP